MTCYQNGKIYKIVNDVDDKIYIGSTCNPLYKRFYDHKSRGKGWQPEFKVYSHLNKVGWDNVSIILIENYPCKTMDELRARERYHYDQVPPNLRLNTANPKLTEQDLIDRKNAKEKKKAERKAERAAVRDAKEMKEAERRAERDAKEMEEAERRAAEFVAKFQAKCQASLVKKHCECGSRVRGLSAHLKTQKHQRWQEIYDFIVS